MAEKHQLGFYLLRYVPDAVKDEFVNIGVLLLGEGADAGYADIRLTRDWRRVLCLDPGADLAWLQALERDLRMRLQEAGSRADILYRLQDLCSNGIQLSSFKGCLGEEPAREIETLAKMYVDVAPLRAGKREPVGRMRIVAAMREAFERENIWALMQKNVTVEKYTHKGDPLKIDCSYQHGGAIKMFQGVALSSDVNFAKALAFSYPEMLRGIVREEGLEPKLTAVVEENLDWNDEGILFAAAMMERSRIEVVDVKDLPTLAEAARIELKA
jgi:hypothetical protein